MARIFGLEAIRMADADVLPYDYEEYGKEIGIYIEAAKVRSQAIFGSQAPPFSDAISAAKRFQTAGASILAEQKTNHADSVKLNQILRDAER